MFLLQFQYTAKTTFLSKMLFYQYVLTGVKNYWTADIVFQSL